MVDVSKGATFSVPASKTYQIIEVIDQQNYIVDVVYPGKSLTITPENLTYEEHFTCPSEIHTSEISDRITGVTLPHPPASGVPRSTSARPPSSA